ncbi:MAG: M3 family metallopeptidase [Alphaproteobacteria bacterium]|nr:M3 family metallopeptidase [Alphaproteobacteria bacterium]
MKRINKSVGPAPAKKPSAAHPAAKNPVLTTWRTPFGLPPFDRIATQDLDSGLKQALKVHRAAVKEIANAETRPTFANTIVAMEKAGLPLERVCAAFFNLVNTCATPQLQEIERDIAPRLAEHDSAIFLNTKLYKRVAFLFERSASLKLTPEQSRLLERYHTWFVRAGAGLKPADRKRVAEINMRLAELSTAFNQNVLADENSWHMVLSGEADLAGLPDGFRAGARRAARDLGIKGEAAHAITLARSSVEGFLTFSARRDLREKAWAAWINRGANGGKTDNRTNLAEIAGLRAELAKLLGFDTYADFVLEDTMAKTPAAVGDLLQRVWKPAVARAAEERDALVARAREEGSNAPLQAWDWRYYAEKERKARYDMDAGQLRQYLQLENVIAAAFDCAGKLFGVMFKELEDPPRYHPDVRVWEVTDSRNNHVAVFVGDYFARTGKRSGAWMSSFRSSHAMDTKPVRPIIVNVTNFARGADGEPSLISWDDARTLFHEFGHGLHGMLSQTVYPSLSGTSVSRDFVELPSQLYEHWFAEPEVLERFALHYKSGKPMPKTLINKLKKAETFNQGFATVEFLSCALLDMELHAKSELETGKLDIAKFESAELERIGMPREIVMRHRLPHFMHISGGYAAGYYSYMWSEVMDSDAFEAFKETGDIFDKKTAHRLKQYIYSAGNTRDPEQLWSKFRGRPPAVEGLLKKRGLV